MSTMASQLRVKQTMEKRLRVMQGRKKKKTLMLQCLIFDGGEKGSLVRKGKLIRECALRAIKKRGLIRIN